MTAFEVFTLFPEAIEGFVSAGLLGKAIERGHVTVQCTNYRDFTTDKHRTVDDTPFGGGPGMVMMPGPVVDALEHVTRARGAMHRVLLTPSAPRFDHAAAVRLSKLPRIGLLCGRYEGIDDRVREHFVDECLSLGDFVLGGGEVAALAMIEAISRLQEGVLGNPESAELDSFADDTAGTAGTTGSLLEYPQYTRPADFRGHAVPDVLRSGDHDAIARWRADAARRRTWALRPDLRPTMSLPEGCPIYLVLDAALAADPAPWVTLARHHAVAGVMLVGGSPEAAADWARAAGGRPTVAALADWRSARKRLRRAGGAEPWVVHAVRGATRTEPAATSAAEVLDALQVADGPSGRVLAVWIGAAPPPGGPAAAIYAPAPADVAAARDGLALADAIADVSQPTSSAAATADVLLARLGHGHHERDGERESS